MTSYFGCDVPTASLKNGFDVRLFSYPLSGTQFGTRSFYYSEYTSIAMIGSNQVYNTVPSISYRHKTETVIEQWGISFVTFPLLAEFTMYFKTDITGFHSFIFNLIDDGSMVFLGNGAFACCDNVDISGVQPDSEILWAYKESIATDPDTESIDVYLEAGIYYPMRIVYVNIVHDAQMNFEMKNPFGRQIDLKSHFFVLPPDININECTTTTGQLMTTTVTCTDSCSSAITVTEMTDEKTGSSTYSTPKVIVTTITTTVPYPTCTGPVTSTTETVITTGTAPETVDKVIVSTPVSTLTTTVPCPTCTGPVTITTQTTVPCPTCTGPVTTTLETVFSCETGVVTVTQIVVCTPVSTITTTVSCKDCDFPVTVTSNSIIIDIATTLTVTKEIILTPVKTFTYIVPCGECAVPVTITLERVVENGTSTATVTEVIISNPTFSFNEDLTYQNDNDSHQPFTGTYRTPKETFHTKDDSNSWSPSSSSIIYEDNTESLSEYDGGSNHQNVRVIFTNLSVILFSIFFL